MKRAAAWIAGVILVVSACSGSENDDDGAARPTSSTASGTAAAEGLEINLDDNYFEPKVLTGTGGQAVTLKLVNRGTASHNFSLIEQRIDTDMKKGESASVKVTFPGNGELMFFCKFHKDEAGMVGTLKVRVILDGYRVIELGAWVAGPGAGGVMADWGADVIKIETPGGDPMRRVFAVGSGHLQSQSPPFDLDNRGKRSVVLDLRDPGGLATLNKLIGTADVFLTNLRPDALERLKLDHGTVLPAHPRLVYASVSGYGLEGPDRLRPGYDVGAFSARSGLAHLQGEVFDEPVGVRAGMGDHVTSMTALTGILGALLYRERTGQGQLVSTSLLRSGIYSIGWELGIQLRFGKLATSQPRTEAANPMVNSYRAGDDKWFWLLGLEAERHWPSLMKALGDPPSLLDERFADPRGRRKHAIGCIAALDQIFASRTRDEWTEIFDRHDVWWAPVQTAPEVLADPQAIAAGAFIDVPAGIDESAPAHKAVASPLDFSAVPLRPRPVPALGQHTAEVLAELDGG